MSMQRKNFQIRKNIPVKPRDNVKPLNEFTLKISRENSNAASEKNESNIPRNNFESPQAHNAKHIRRPLETNDVRNPRSYIQSRPVMPTDTSPSILF